jgi:hypothetical protein
VTRRFKRQSPLPLSEACLLRGLSGSCLGLNWVIVWCFSLSFCVFLHIGFSFLQIYFFLLKWIASQPVRDSGCQYQKPFLGLDCLCVIFCSVFRHIRGLIRLSPRIPTRCSGTARGYTRVVLVTVAGLLGDFSAWVGQSSPPVVRRAPLRSLEPGAAQSTG